MKIGKVAHGPRFVLDAPGLHQLFNFRIGAVSASELDLLHSSAATPARYVAEMARRLCRMPGKGPLAVVSPLLKISSSEMGLVVTGLGQGASDDIRVVRDAQGSAVAYRFPARFVEETGDFLALMSALDAEADARLLRALFWGDVTDVHLPTAFEFEDAGFYVDSSHRSNYVWSARHALAELEAREEVDPHAIPIAAVMPFHAGDVLFLLLALKRVPGPCRAVVVDRRYRDIVRDVAPDLACIEIDLAGARNQRVDWDPLLSEAFAGGALPRGYFYVYCRPSRQYDEFPVHLIDQYAFALGDSGMHGCVRGAERDRPAPGASEARKVLLHVDGGWSLKIYPESMQRELIGGLRGAGFAVTVLSSREEETIAGCRNERFRSLDQLRRLLLDHEILVGMDSFPAHYAAHVLGMPTVCLFASTQPANSDAMPSERYRALEVGLSCCPCRALSQCPRYGGTVCRNFVAPDQVLEAVARMSLIRTQ